MNAPKILIGMLLSLASAFAGAPIPDFKNLITEDHGKTYYESDERYRLPKTPECEDFMKYVTSNDFKSYGLVILKDGKVLTESYFRGAERDNKFRLYSISKTLSGLMLGALATQKRVDLEEQISNYIKIEKRKKDVADRTQIKFKNLWNMGSGLDWCEYRECHATDPMHLMYGRAREDSVKFVLDHKLIATPGNAYIYSAGNYSLLAGALYGVLEKQGQINEYNDLPGKLILNRIGVEDYVFERDDKGIFLGGTGLSMNLRAFASLGQLLLNNGVWGEDRIISKSIFSEMLSLKASPLLGTETKKEVRDWEGPAGASLWLNSKQDGIPQFFPRTPTDMFYSGGKFGQFLIMLPSSGIVLARIGADENHSPHWNPFTEKALACLDKKALVDVPTKKIEDPKQDLLKDAQALWMAVHDNLIVNLKAQELCSCRFSNGFNNNQICDELYPTPPGMVDALKTLRVKVKANVIEAEKKVVVEEHGLGIKIGRAIAAFDSANPHKGCRLIKRASPLDEQVSKAFKKILFDKQ